MKAREMIEKLQKLPPDTEVFASTHWGMVEAEVFETHGGEVHVLGNVQKLQHKQRPASRRT